MVSELDYSGLSGPGTSPGQNTLLCPWATHFHNASLYPGVHCIDVSDKFNAMVKTVIELASFQGEVEIQSTLILRTPRYYGQNQDP